MIYDDLAFWRRYVPHRNASEFCQAIEFLRTFTPDIAEGKHVLKEGLIYASVQEYTPKKLAEGAIEYHKEFVDLQTLLAGTEYTILCIALNPQSGYFSGAILGVRSVALLHLGLLPEGHREGTRGRNLKISALCA